jgi:hypothetical protein
MSVSLHLQAKLERGRAWLLPLLLPESCVVLAQRDSWLDIYAEQMSADLSDIEELCVPLSQHTPIYCVVFERQVEVYCFFKGALQSLSQALPEGIAQNHLFEYETARVLLRTGVLQGLLLEFEPEKPGLAEFFGRSADE